MPKNGEGSSSPFVEVEFENRVRTQLKYKDLNPIWKEKPVFHVNDDVADLPYRTLEVNIFNAKRSTISRNFLSGVRISESNIARKA